MSDRPLAILERLRRLAKAATAEQSGIVFIWRMGYPSYTPSKAYKRQELCSALEVDVPVTVSVPVQKTR
jgi:hypothetical protein